jgi:hypothetical protein
MMIEYENLGKENEPFLLISGRYSTRSWRAAGIPLAKQWNDLNGKLAITAVLPTTFG